MWTYCASTARVSETRAAVSSEPWAKKSQQGRIERHSALICAGSLPDKREVRGSTPLRPICSGTSAVAIYHRYGASPCWASAGHCLLIDEVTAVEASTTPSLLRPVRPLAPGRPAAREDPAKYTRVSRREKPRRPASSSMMKLPRIRGLDAEEASSLGSDAPKVG